MLHGLWLLQDYVAQGLVTKWLNADAFMGCDEEEYKKWASNMHAII